MANYIGNSYTLTPGPGTFIAGGPSRTPKSERTEISKDIDSRVRWAQRMASTLRREKQQVTAEMKQAWGLYSGDGHWAKQRPKWKVRATINYCFWVPQQWAATLADNNPRATFSTYDIKDQRDADIMTAAWTDAYTRLGWQNVIRNTILGSRIEKKSFLRLTFDPWANGGSGDPKLEYVSGLQLYTNAGATNVDNADVVMYDYEESYGELIQRYPKLRKKLKDWLQNKRENDGENDINTPATFFVQPQSGNTKYMPPYGATQQDPAQATGSGGIPVQEFWTRPKGPKALCTVKSLVFNVGNEPATEPKTITFEDGHEEPLQIVVTEGNVVYELPYSQVKLLQFAESMGGIKIKSVHDSVTVFKKKRKVNMYPGGRRLVIAGDHVADDGMNPFCHMDWPFVEIPAYNDPRKMWGLGDIDLIHELNAYVNRLFSILLDSAILTANPIWRIPLGSEMSDEDITNAPGAVMREDMQSLKNSKREAGPDMPGYLKELLDFGIERIKEISGLTELNTGSSRPRGNQSTEMVSMYQEAAGIRFRDAHHSVERAIQRLGMQFKGIVGQFYNTPRIARIKNAAGVEEPVVFFGSSVNTPMTMDVKAGSMLPTSPGARLQYMMTLLNQQKPVIDLKEVWNLLQEVGLIESATALERRITKELGAKTEGNDTWKVLGIAPPPKPGQQKGMQSKKPGSSNSKGKQV